jgi:hypothetical protein
MVFQSSSLINPVRRCRCTATALAIGVRKAHGIVKIDVGNGHPQVMATDENVSVCELKRPISPYPGDGICPTTLQLDEATRQGYEHWSNLGLDTSIPCTTDCILDLLRYVPAFYAQPSAAFSILDEPFPQVKYVLEWVTTGDSSCDQPVKRTYHQQLLGIVKPMGYEFINTSEKCPYWPGIGADRAQYLSYLIFGWIYVLSSRWVEILQDTGEKVFLQQSKELNHHNFWEVVAGQHWQASIIRGEKTFYAPWSLRANDAAPQHAEQLLTCQSNTLT